LNILEYFINNNENNENKNNIEKINERNKIRIMLIRKRLIYLFVKDLTGGVSGEALENKELRDFSSTTKISENKVCLELKVIVWLFILFLNIGMLFYVYLFAINQTQDRQSAWFISFIIWLIFEIIISSTGIVLVIHLLIPLYVLTDLSKIKNKVVEILVLFQRKYLKEKEKEREREREKGEEKENINEFNSVKYLFVSWKVASLFPEFQESQMILQFKSPFPTKRLVIQEEMKSLSEQYEEGVIIASLTRLLTYYITSILSFHHLFQDTIIQFICNSFVGYLWIIMYRLYKIQPLLPLVPIIGVIVCIHFLTKSYQQESSRKSTSIKEIVPIVTNDEGNENENNLNLNTNNYNNENNDNNNK